MKIIVTGANGFSGQHLCTMLAAKGFEVHGLSRGVCRIPVHPLLQYHDVELTSVRSVQAVFRKVQPDVVIHTAAMSKPDDCHLNPKACLKNNVDVTALLLEASNAYPVHFIHFSTDFIFGENGPHAEDDTPTPLNFYGESKYLAEQLVFNSGITTTIVRPVFIYGKVWEGIRPGFIQWVHNNLINKQSIKVVTDQLRTPTYIVDLCAGIETIIKHKKTGVYHLAGKEILSPYDMAVQTAEVLQLNKALIIPVTAAAFPEPVIRAKRSGLKIDKAVAELGYAPQFFKHALQEIFNR